MEGDVVKITATRREDVLKRKAQYDEDVREYERRDADSRMRMNQAEDAATEPLRNKLDSVFAQFDALTFDYQIDRNWERYNTSDSVRVSIRCNEHNKFDEDVALAWSYTAYIDAKSGEVVRESSSWSGLSATTPAQMKSLEQTVAALKILNSMDWRTILSVELPKFSDFYDADNKRPSYVDFNKELSEATIADAVGTDIWIKVYNWDGSPWRGTYVWVNPTRETNSQFICNVIDNWTISGYKEDSSTVTDAAVYHYSVERRIRKSSLTVASDEDTIEIPRS